ncbi:MFS transporter [Nocardioides sp. cx-173]|uniref:CynX/NimT family MFS transporter n=1 Tax=Nocardioides sp. cx-173 TaxID=2898796 RepID=UPI001E5BFF26|nr:MFS transporter [Nocardioides sp. cx-173]MCD4526493.1 MFS transporter [Nocardioides sp. cx-173]UGB41180.1 MFS transporter [Nocardioides sp. cx-173]
MTDAPAPQSRAGKLLVLVGIVVLAFNLRPAAVSVGPVLDEIRDGLGMSGTEAGVLTSLPVLAFAVFGGLAPRLARRVGTHRLTLLALLCVLAGLLLRSRTDGVAPFLLLSLLALSGMATANVVLPSLVKQHFPERVGLLTALYSTALAIGLTAASVATVPIGDALGDWRHGLGVWALTAALAALPWLGLLRHDRPPADPDGVGHAPIGLVAVARTRLGLAMALFFGLQSLQAYAIFGWFPAIFRDAGYSAAQAGVLLGVITGVSIPLSFVIPSLAARRTDQRSIVSVLVACYPLGYAGMILAPYDGAWLWAVLVGVGTCTFPLILTQIGLRARTPAGTAALSGFTQSTGYLLAALGPFGVGLLHDASGGWTLPLLALIALSVPLLALGLAVARPAYLEDQLASSSPRRRRAPTR